MEWNKLDLAIEQMGYEEVISRLKLISLNLKRLGLDYSEYNLVILDLEKRWNEDFWAEWKNYETI